MLHRGADSRRLVHLRSYSYYIPILENPTLPVFQQSSLKPPSFAALTLQYMLPYPFSCAMRTYHGDMQTK